MLESKIQARIMKGLKDAGIYAYKNITTNRAGIPDICACVDGAFVMFEVKNEKGKATELQLWNIEQIQKSGGYAHIVRSWEEVAQIIRNIQYER